MSKKHSELIINKEGRECSKCKVFKKWEEYSIDKTKTTGRRPSCRKCGAKLWKNRKVTPYAVISHIYSNQVWRSKNRKNFPPPNYSREDFYNWYMANGFMKLYNNWINKGMDKDYTPSGDRINSKKPYTLNNLQLLTWKENDLKGHKEGTKSIYVYNQQGLPLKRFNTAKDARNTFKLWGLNPKKHYYRKNRFIVIYEDNYSLDKLITLVNNNNINREA